MLMAPCLTAMLVLATAISASGQERSPNAPTPLSELLTEASQNNSQIAAADYGWQAAKEVPRQVSTLPDPTFTYQQFSVGSPKPFAGYTNSNFSYVGIGASQELPYPGKLRLRGDAAQRDTDIKERERDATSASVADAVKADYLQLAYLQTTLGILMENRHVLEQLIQDATAHYGWARACRRRCCRPRWRGQNSSVRSPCITSRWDRSKLI